MKRAALIWGSRVSVSGRTKRSPAPPPLSSASSPWSPCWPTSRLRASPAPSGAPPGRPSHAPPSVIPWLWCVSISGPRPIFGCHSQTTTDNKSPALWSSIWPTSCAMPPELPKVELSIAVFLCIATADYAARRTPAAHSPHATWALPSLMCLLLLIYQVSAGVGAQLRCSSAALPSQRSSARLGWQTESVAPKTAGWPMTSCSAEQYTQGCTQHYDVLIKYDNRTLSTAMVFPAGGWRPTPRS